MMYQRESRKVRISAVVTVDFRLIVTGQSGFLKAV